MKQMQTKKYDFIKKRTEYILKYLHISYFGFTGKQFCAEQWINLLLTSV